MPFLTPTEYDASRVKIAKINDRAVKRGFTGRYDIVGTPTTKTITTETGLQILNHGFDVTITGDPPRYNGYTLLASLDWEQGGVIVHTAPGVDTVNRDSIEQGLCVHCNTNRRRIKGYLVGNDDGDQLQVGSTCLKDFLGHDGSPVFLSTDQIEDDMDWGGSGWNDPHFDVIGILALSYSLIVEFGYTKANEPGATKDLVIDVVNDRTDGFTPDELDRVRGRADEAVGKATEIRDWLTSDDFTGDSEYVNNLKVVATSEAVGWRSLGLLVSAPQTYLRNQERQETLRLEVESHLNEYVGIVGDRFEVDLTVGAVRYIHGQYGTTALYTMRDSDGRAFKWFSSNHGFGDDPVGQTFRVKGTVKKHDEFQGLKSTILTRCTITEGIPA